MAAAEKKVKTVWLAEKSDFSKALYCINSLYSLQMTEFALTCAQETLRIHGANEMLLSLMGMMASEMSLFSTAEKIWANVIQINPNEFNHYKSYINSMLAQNKIDEASQVLGAIGEKYQSKSEFWEILATIYDLNNIYQPAIDSYLMGLEIDPENVNCLGGLATIFKDSVDAEPLWQKALSIDNGNPENHIGYAFHLFSQGRLEEAWDHYEYRLAPNRTKGQSINFPQAPQKWQGEDLSSKSLLLCAEQGIGDEVLFMMIAKQLCEQAGTLYIAVEERLVSMLERAYPQAVVFAYDDTHICGRTIRQFGNLKAGKSDLSTIDYFAPLMSALKYVWPTLNSIPVYTDGYLTANADYARSIKQQIDDLGPGLKIGIAWSSMNVGQGRQGGYSKLADWYDVLTLKDVHFINLQYGDVQAEIDFAKAEFDCNIIEIQGVDLKQDLEGNLAIMDGLDIVLGPGTSTSCLSAALGKETWLISYGRPFYDFGNDSAACLYLPHLRWFDRDHQDDGWTSVLKSVSTALINKSKQG